MTSAKASETAANFILGHLEAFARQHEEEEPTIRALLESVGWKNGSVSFEVLVSFYLAAKSRFPLEVSEEVLQKIVVGLQAVNE